MRFRDATAVCLFRAALGFNIISPRPAEVINVEEYYNLTWTTTGLPADSIVNEIRIDCPDPAVLYADENAWVYNRFQGGEASPFNISATRGYHTMGLALWWSSLYNNLPHLNGSWSISLTVSNQAPNGTRLDDLNDTVEVMLISPSHAHDQRPRLDPVTTFGIHKESGSGTPSKNKTGSAMGVWPVVLSILLPVVFLVAIVCLARFRWKRHAYGALSPGQRIKRPDISPYTTPARVMEGADSKNSTQQRVEPASSSSRSRFSSRFSSNFPSRFYPRSLPFEFLLAALLAIAPLVALLGALVSLLLIHKVTPSQDKTSSFLFNSSSLSDPAAFYIDYDATRYTTVASWTSSIALLLPGFLTTLTWYRQTQQLESDAALSQYEKLPTPYQLSLLLGLKSGTLGSLWDYILYIASRRREKQANFLFEAGFVVLLSTLLGLGLWAADTWLHIATSTVSLTSAISSSSPQSWVSLKQYGRALDQNCTSAHLSSIGQEYSCLLLPLLADVPPVLTDSVRYSSVISERDENTTIKSITLGSDRVAYLGPTSPPSSIDYRANTFAVRSVCQTIDAWCGLPLTNPSLPWLPAVRQPASILAAYCGKFVGIPSNTSEVIYGTVVSQGVVGAVTSFFKDQQWQEVMTVNNTANSFYTVSRLDSNLKPSANSLPTHSTGTKAGFLWSNFIGCNTELLNFTYTYVNGSITAADMAPLDNLDLAMAVYPAVLFNFDPLFTSGAAITATAGNFHSALENWIDTWHRSYLALAAIATTEKDNIEQQQRVTQLVARIPKAPLFMLGILLILSIVFNSFILFSSLWRAKLGTTHPKQIIISIAGLAANSFDSNVANTGHAIADKWDLFDEGKEDSPSVRIGISENSAGGHHFTAFAAQGGGGRGNERDNNDQEESRSSEEQREGNLPGSLVFTTETAAGAQVIVPTDTT